MIDSYYRRAFDQLRTKEQLGYVVFTGQLLQATTMGYRVLIQSERSCEYLEQRIEAFLSSDWTLTDEEFEKHQQSVLTRLSESLKNLNQESNRLWWYVASEAYDFLQIDHDIENVSKLSKEDMMEFYKTYISPSSPKRAKLSVHLKSIAKSGAADLSAAEHVINALTQFMSAVLPTPPSQEDIRSAFPNIDLSSTKALAERVREYMLSKGVDVGMVDAAVEKGMEMMEQLMPQLQAMEAEKTTTSQTQNEHKKVTVIEDVDAWRRSLVLSKGPIPVQDLSDFEETGVKL